MAEIVLSQAGAVAGNALLPEGLKVFGQQIAGAAIGKAVGSVVGRAIDASLTPPQEGPRIESLQVMESREGASLPSVYGRGKVSGQVIWASRFKEKRREQSAGKGGPSYTEYSYSISFAIALCEGPITRLDRVWANGESLILKDFNWRLYRGTEDQLPDPLIEAIEGTGNAPAYRGTAYIVFEDFPLDGFGNRMPQLSFEIVRAGADGEGQFRDSIRGVNIIPASGEFVYATDIVRERRFPGIETSLNMNNSEGRADFLVSLDQLSSDLPNAKSAALTVAWFGDDLRAESCKIRPGVEMKDRTTVPFSWSVDGQGRADAYLVSETGGAPNYGGTPSDEAVLQGIAAMKNLGISVTLSPFLLMDIPSDNTLTDPYGEANQAAFPWRGRIVSESDGTAQARSDIEAFVGIDGAFGYRHFILHHARLAEDAGGVEAFLLGSEFVGLTRIRDHQGKFPFVEALKALAGEVRAILGPSVKISYAADWTEYGSYTPQDSSGDVLFPLDELWGDTNIDFIGIDWYPPLGDWRDGTDHLDAQQGFVAADQPSYLADNIEGGEAYDWYYADDAARLAQMRLPIIDTAHGEDWVFRQKDLRSWWTQAHFERPGGVRSIVSTPWVAQSKLVRLIEIGFPAIDRGGNSPNLFYDPKSAESAFPPFSNGSRDDLYQRRALVATNTFWNGQSFIEDVLVWAWDGRPWPAFPALKSVWSDGDNWQYGHWLNGRTGLMALEEVIEDLFYIAGLEVNASGVEGFVEGYVLPGRSSLRSALAPLQALYEFSAIEREGKVHIESFSDDNVAIVNPRQMVDQSFTMTFAQLEQVPSSVSVNYISGDGSYDPAVATVISDDPDTDRDLSVVLPLVLGEARARDFAAQKLEETSALYSTSFTLGPEGLWVEPGSAIDFEGEGGWIVTETSFEKSKIGLKLELVSSLSLSHRAVEGVPIVVPAETPATPELIVIDAVNPVLPEMARPLCAVAASPWPGQVALAVGADAPTLTTRSTVSSPNDIGVLTTDLPAGPIGRWDDGATIEVEIHADFASLSDMAVLNGAGTLFISGSEGWETLAYRDAALISPGVWKLSGLLRGLFSSRAQLHAAGSVAVVADNRLAELPLSPEEYGLDLLIGMSSTPLAAFKFEDVASLPPRVAHLRYKISDSGYDFTWTARDQLFPNSWAFPEADNVGLFEVETIKADTTSLINRVSDASFSADFDVVEVRVASVANDGRAGEWVSIAINGV